MAALGALNAAEQHKPFFYAHLSFAVTLGVFLGLCAAGEAADLGRNLLVYAALDALVAVVVWIHLGVVRWPPLPSFDRAVATRYFLYGLPLVIQNVATWVISLSDRYLLKLWESTDSVASYILGYQLASSVITIPLTLAMTIIFPRAIRIDRDAGVHAALDYTYHMLGYYVRYIAIIALLGCGIVIPFKHFVYPAYEFHPYVMVVIVLAQVVAGLLPFLSKEFELNGRTLVITKGIGLGAAANVGLNLALIPALGLTGAALATLAAYGMSVVYLYRGRTYTGRIP
jgi:O-antigen/teichoic acid export membrane protein